MGEAEAFVLEEALRGVAETFLEATGVEAFFAEEEVVLFFGDAAATAEGERVRERCSTICFFC